METNLSMVKPDSGTQSLAAALFRGIVESSFTSTNIVPKVVLRLFCSNDGV